MKLFALILSAVMVMVYGKGSMGMKKPDPCSSLEGRRPLALCFEYCITRDCPTKTAGNARCKVLRKKFFRKAGTRIFPCDPTTAPVAISKAPSVAPALMSKVPSAAPKVSKGSKGSKAAPSAAPSSLSING
ncbi:hypothetical protein MPSEU_000913900 [Mayamaea pseudoterrestris]|nr:hypothetical protein MPSEU_000913900 [Mayamaea pseudoterrestris]